MIISHKYKFIFIKTRKTAGSSISNVLRKYLGPNDIADGDWVDGLEPLNVTYDRNSKDGHQTSLWIKKNFPKEFDTYYKFTVERNPWQKVPSGYKFYKKINVKNLPNNITDFLKWEKKKWIPVDWNWYTIKDKIVVDNIIQYDHLHSEFKTIMNRLDIPYQDELSTVKMKSFKTDEVYKLSKEDDKLIKDLFHKEIKFFNYTKVI